MSQPAGPAHVETISTHAVADAIVIPDANLLFTGDFKRFGVDLVLSKDDRELVLHDYQGWRARRPRPGRPKLRTFRASSWRRPMAPVPRG